MKRFILSIHILLLSAILVAAADYKVSVGETQFTVAVTQSGTTYTIGNGRNACIPQFQSGTLTVPRITTTAGDQNIIGKFAFRFCSNITKIVVEEGITAIEDFAFVGCGNVESIVLPASLTRVGRGAFIGLPNLKSVECKGTAVPTWSRADVFSYEGTEYSMIVDAMKRVLYVPEGCAESYREYKYNNDVGWGDAFTRIYETSSDRQTISSLDELKAFRDAVNTGARYKDSDNKMVVLTADIDMSSIDNWVPIGISSEHPYEGVFDGGGFVIKNLKVNRSENYSGLFGYAKKSTIYNMHIQNPTVVGSDYVGTLVGYVEGNTRVTDILVSSNVASDNAYTVQATNGSVGGLVGRAENATIERCMFRGHISGSESGWTGGIVGNIGSNVTVADCSASNILAKGADVGGIVGGAASVTVKRCFSQNEYHNTPTTSGWIVGHTTHDNVKNTVSNCVYWNPGGSNVPHNIIGRWNPGDSKDYSGNLEKTNKNDMKQDGVKTTLGTENWYYFTGGYIDYPVPITLKDMYLANCVDWKDDKGIVYRSVGKDDDLYYEVIGYTGNAKSLAIPDYYNSKPVGGIASEAFKDNATLESITIGSNVTSIGARAFEDCDALTSISLPNSVTSVGEDAFLNCGSLTSFNIGTGFKDYTGNFLADCPELTTLTASAGNSNGYQCVDNVLIRNVAGDCSYLVACAPGKLGDYTIPTASLTETNVSVMDNCFANCTGLTSITFPAGKNYNLKSGLFDEAYNLKVVDMSNVDNFIDGSKSTIHLTVDRMKKENAFYGLDDLTIVYLPSGNEAEDYEPNVFVLNGDKTAASANFISLEDGIDFKPKVPVTATVGISYLRYVNYTQQQADESYKALGITACLPYSLTITDDNVKVYAPSKIEGVEGSTTATFTEVTNKQMAAYKPYYIVIEENLEIDFGTEETTEIAKIPTAEPDAIGGFMFKGTTVTIPNTELYNSQKPAYLLQSDGKWHKVPQNQPLAYVGPFRAYFQATGSSPVRAFNMVIGDDDATSIQQIRTIDADGAERYYDMNGRLLDGKPQKGMYIHKGKKYVNK